MEEPTYNGRTEMCYEYNFEQKLESSPDDSAVPKMQTVYSRDALFPERLEMLRIKSGYYLKSEELVKLMYPDLYVMTQYLEKKPKERTEQTPPRALSPITCCNAWSRENAEGAQEQGSTYAVNEDNSWSTVSLTSSPEDNMKAEEQSGAAPQPAEQEPNVYKTPNSPVKSMIDEGWFKELDSVFPLDSIDE